MTDRSSLPVRELGLSHLISAEDDVENALHRTQELLVWRGCSTLEVGYDGGGGVALGRKVLLCHSRALVVLGLGAGLGDGLSDGGTNRLWLYDIIGSVDFCEALTFLRS